MTYTDAGEFLESVNQDAFHDMNGKVSAYLVIRGSSILAAYVGAAGAAEEAVQHATELHSVVATLPVVYDGRSV